MAPLLVPDQVNVKISSVMEEWHRPKMKVCMGKHSRNWQRSSGQCSQRLGSAKTRRRQGSAVLLITTLGWDRVLCWSKRVGKFAKGTGPREST